MKTNENIHFVVLCRSKASYYCSRQSEKLENHACKLHQGLKFDQQVSVATKQKLPKSILTKFRKKLYRDKICQKQKKKS